MGKVRRWRNWVILAIATGAAASLVAYIAIGSILVAPSRHAQPPPPADLQAVRLVLASPSGATLAAWLVEPPAPPRAAMIVLHGIRADRSSMLRRAKLLRREGFAVLVPDLQAHGESTGHRITLGFLEARDAEACVSYMRDRFAGLPVGAIGVSMGGAAVALAGDRLDLQAAVLEGVYPTIEDAVDNRVKRRVGLLSRILTPMLLLQLEPLLGISPDDLRPIEAVKTLNYPLLIISGTADLETTEEQTRALFAAARAPKELWLVPGAGHVDLLRYDSEGYRGRVLPFLRGYLLRPT